MKLILDIPNEIYEDIKHGYICSEYADTLIQLIPNSKPYEERSQGEYVDISKLRLMTVEECAGHTIDYAMGWKACVEWIKKGGAEWDKKQH